MFSWLVTSLVSESFVEPRECKPDLQDHGLKAFSGDDASVQRGNLQEIHLEETAVSWIRRKLFLGTPTSAAKGARDEYCGALCHPPVGARSFPEQVRFRKDLPPLAPV